MTNNDLTLAAVYSGWDGYQTSIRNAVSPLTSAQLAWRPSPNHRSVGELVRHIALSRVGWFSRMGAPGSTELVGRITVWERDSDGNDDIVETAVEIANDAVALVDWLDASWGMVARMLAEWSVPDLAVTYRHKWNGDVYAVSRQWTIWRILSHDTHHGGELSLMLGLQGIEAFELSALGGHIVLPPLAA